MTLEKSAEQRSIGIAEARLMDWLAKSQDSVTFYDCRRLCVFANETAAHWLGRPQSELVGKTWREAGVAERLGKGLDERLDVALSSRAAVRTEALIGVGGDEFVVEFVLSPILRSDEMVEGVLEVGRDLSSRPPRVPETVGQVSAANLLPDRTVQKRAEESVRDTEKQFRIVAEQTGQLLYDWNVVTGVIRWEGSIRAMLGESRESLVDLGIDAWSERIHPTDRPKTLELLERARQECSKYHTEYRFRRADGEYFWVEDRGVYLLGPDGQASRMLGTMSDISGRKQNELVIRESEVRFRTVFEHSPLGMLLLGDMGRIIDVNPAMLAFLDRSREEFLELGIEGVTYGPDRGQFASIVQRYARGGYPVIHLEKRYLRKDGKVLWGRLTISRIPNRSEVSIVALVEDITARKETEQALRESEARFRAMVENTTDNLFWIDVRQDGALVFEG